MKKKSKLTDKQIMKEKKIIARALLAVIVLSFLTQVYYVPETLDWLFFSLMSFVLVFLTLLSVTSFGFSTFKSSLKNDNFTGIF